LCRSDLGGESFFYLKPDSGLVKAERLSRGATFLGIFLAWHFVTEGVDGQESVPAADLAGRILSNFDFNMLVPVFLPVRGRGRQRAETEQNRDKMIDAIRTFLNELARYRFVELRPSVRTEWRDLQVYRLPGLQRFLEVSRNALLHQGSEATDLLGVVRTLWAGFETEPQSDDNDDAAEDE
jgi:chromosome partition protein MukE